jgi:maleylpyruvate isomerase
MPADDVALELEDLHHCDQRVVRTVDSLTDADWGAPSLLPGWTRAHVVAHLALNAEGFAGALVGLVEGDPVPIYPSNESRDAGINELAAQPPDEIRERFFAATQHFRDVAEQLDDGHWAGTVHRLPEGPEWPAAGLVGARRREVEIHHADLGTTYRHTDWPTGFTVALLDQVTAVQDFAVSATDLGRTWSLGARTPVVSGAASALAWWLIGRGDGSDLVCDQGALPVLGPWQRPPR